MGQAENPRFYRRDVALFILKDETQRIRAAWSEKKTATSHHQLKPKERCGLVPRSSESRFPSTQCFASNVAQLRMSARLQKLLLTPASLAPCGVPCSGTRCRRKLSVCEVPFRKTMFDSRVPVRSDVFLQKVQQDLYFRRQLGWAIEECA